MRQCNGFFDCLFGGGSARRAEPAPDHRAPATRRKRSRPQRSRRPQPPPEPAVEKLDNARVVLVVGDFLGGGLADGLKAAYAESPGVRIIDRTNGSSGFVRDDFYDWNAEIGQILDEVDPRIVVVMIGSNDRQQLVVNGQRREPRSEAWTRQYKSRVKNFINAIRERELPLIWTGLPPFKSSSMSSDMLAFNDIYKQMVEDAGGEFVDIWEGFVDENGNFVFNGPDINGQRVRLRGNDGINLTRAARRKVAYYVEKPLGKMLGEAASPDIGKLDMEALPDLNLPAAPAAAPDRTPPISLTDPDLDGGSELMGAAETMAGTGLRAIPVEAAAQLPKPAGGLSGKPPPNRADNFSIRRATTAAGGP